MTDAPQIPPQIRVDADGWMIVADRDGTAAVQISPDNRLVTIYGTDGSVLAAWDRRVSEQVRRGSDDPVASNPDFEADAGPFRPVKVYDTSAIHSVMYRDGRHGTLCGIPWPIGGRMLQATSVAAAVTCTECRTKLDPGQQPPSGDTATGLWADAVYGQPADYAGTSVSRPKMPEPLQWSPAEAFKEASMPLADVLAAAEPGDSITDAWHKASSAADTPLHWLWGTDEEYIKVREGFKNALRSRRTLPGGLTGAELASQRLSTVLNDLLVTLAAAAS